MVFSEPDNYDVMVKKDSSESKLKFNNHDLKIVLPSQDASNKGYKSKYQTDKEVMALIKEVVKSPVA